MTKLPGLTRQDDRPSVGASNRGRVQVRNPIGDVALQPQARPVDTYSRPQAAPSGPNGLQQLAGALAQISPALTNFLDNSAAKAQKDAEDRAMRRIGGMSFQEARDAVNSGKMSEMDNPWFKAAFMKQYGERLAYERVNELSTKYETNFDKNFGDVDGLIRGRTSEDLEQYGNDPHFTGAYTKVMDGFGARAKTAQAQYKTEQVKQDTVSGVYDTFHGEATALRESGKSPQEIVNTLRGKYEGNRSLLHVDYKEQDKEMVRLAEAFAAKGDMEMVNAILNSDRKGADGTVLGPLSANREFQADANRITTNAERQAFDNTEKATRETRYDFLNEAQEGKLNVERFREWHKANPGAYTEAQSIAVINHNNTVVEQQQEQARKNTERLQMRAAATKSEEDLILRNFEAARTGMLPFIEEATVLTDTGGNKTVSVEEQKKALAKRIVDQTERLVQLGKADKEQAFGMQVESFSVNNLTNPKWENVLKSGPKAATPFTLSGGTVPLSLQDSADLYMRLHSANPKLLETHIKDSTDRDFFEAYRVATQYVKLAPEQAMQMAMMQTSDPDKVRSVGTSARLDQVEERVSDIRHGGGWFTSGSPPANKSYVASEISRLGKFYVQNGMDTEDALDEAKTRFLASHTEVGGNFVYTGGKDIPKNFGTLASRAIEKYVEDFGEQEGVEASDLTIRPATNGQSWLIVHQSGQYPVENSARANLTLRSLFEMERERQDKVKQKVIDEHTRKQKDLAAGITPLARMMPMVSGGVFTGYTAEAIRKRDEEDRQASGIPAEPEKPHVPLLERLLPPVRGGLFTGDKYEEVKRQKLADK
ncbi:hypothetical protein G6L90_14460 [Agrobacterium tumefaciens]|uniref:hypothetical protein n=1 Tax=Agrobacterium tumefaciens TaxID=358 RepID=UPI0015722133|nr:hypothetical protein [Agrobacterium tumefaciens]WHO21368.1 hypothetical protein G6L90_14460 [Agrobacterium tumefaciens]